MNDDEIMALGACASFGGMCLVLIPMLTMSPGGPDPTVPIALGLLLLVIGLPALVLIPMIESSRRRRDFEREDEEDR